jgi:hypothetical protein
MSKNLYSSLELESIKMSFRGRRSVNGVLWGFLIILITLLILGIVTQRIIFYILFGVLLFLAILGVIGLFTFLKKTGQESSPTRRSTYDITKGEDYADQKEVSEAKEDIFCDSCGMKQKAGAKVCSNCGKSL